MAETETPRITESEAFSAEFVVVQSDSEIYRKHLRTDRLYYEFNSNSWSFTPDGEGVISYDTLEEAIDQTGLTHKVWVREISEYWDENGYRS